MAAEALMLEKLRERFRRFLKRGDVAVEDRPDSNVDAHAAERSSPPDASGDHLPGTVPPGHIKTYDEGRPKH